MYVLRGIAFTLVLALGFPGWAGWGLDERPAGPGEWGFRPAAGTRSTRNPPSFVWRPQERAARYDLQVAPAGAFDAGSAPAYEARGLDVNVHCPSREVAPGAYEWRFRALDGDGRASSWSRARAFEVGADAASFVLPEREVLLARVPEGHPRLFVRPEDLPAVRERVKGELHGAWQDVVKRCDRLLADPPSTEEPARYPDGTRRGSDAWREVWWGNRRKTIKVLESAATLAFAWRVGGNDAHGQLAKRLLLDAAAWDPRGATGYRYNDEAGMPYAYHFARTYTFVHPLLGEQERALCRAVMRFRGTEMYRHLHPRHLWQPYNSHANRAWHFLGEVGIAFHGEIPEADDWIVFAANVFANVYPVWCDDDGGWHEGVNYWSSYVGRFASWGAVMKSALGLDAYRLPYFSQVGYYAMYLMPPGSVGGGFGDLNARVQSRRLLPLMQSLAGQAGNPYWQWYVEAQGDPKPLPAYYGLLGAGGAAIEPQPPTDLPTSRHFRGTGQAVLNTSLLHAKDNVQLIFKSSPFGSQSHGYEAQNAFLLRAYGDRLLIRSGYRDSYGSQHHRGWMWETKSVNSVTVAGRGQLPHSPAAVGEVTRFHTSDHVDFVEGEAGRAYGTALTRFTRSILFVKPDLVVIRDHLVAPEPTIFEWHVHAPVEMRAIERGGFHVRTERATCTITIAAPSDLVVAVTDRFDPPPRPRVKLREWHGTAHTTIRRRDATFLTLISVRPSRMRGSGSLVTNGGPNGWTVLRDRGGWRATIFVGRGDGDIRVRVEDPDGEEVAAFER